MSKLFEPVTVGRSKLQHRVAMAPLTRYRWGDDYTATPLNVEYYVQRSSEPGTLIVSEATAIAQSSLSARNVPGIWSAPQVESWRAVTSAVHAKGCAIYCQLWHQGRAGKPEVHKEDGTRMLSSSAVPIGEGFEIPEAMTENDIQETIEDYAKAARNAIDAGFDGVEVHGANGYLPDQFLQTTCNQRTDRWGGSIENRARFHVEVTKAIVAAIGADRTAMRLSPYSDFNGMLMDDPKPTFSYLLSQLKPFRLAYLHLIEARITGNDDSDCGGQEDVSWMIDEWQNSTPVLLAGGFSPDSARSAVDQIFKGKDVLIVFGRYFVSNPDLVFRIREGVPLAKYDRSVFYTPKLTTGYADYPFSQQYLQATAQV